MNNSNNKSSWVNDLNQSIDKINKKEKRVKIFGYCILFLGCSCFSFILFSLSQSKLQFINPKLISKKHNPNKIVSEEFNLTKLENKNSKLIENNISQETISQSINKKLKNDSIASLESHTPKKKDYERKKESNKKEGKQIRYYDNGKKWVELNFKNGLREGTQFTWHRNGQLKSELNYVQGRKHGVQKWWEKSGKILNEKIYVNGKWNKN